MSKRCCPDCGRSAPGGGGHLGCRGTGRQSRPIPPLQSSASSNAASSNAIPERKVGKNAQNRCLLVLTVRDQLVQRYWMVEEHTRRSFAFPVPFNIISTILDLFAFFFVYRQSVRRKYPECSTAECFNLFVARNQPFKAGRGPLSWIHGHGHSHCLAQAAESEDESTHQGQDEVEERTFGQQVSAFMERARTAVADEAYAPDTLLGKMSQISEDVKFVQRMQSNSALEGEPPPGIGRLACPHLLMN